MRAEELGTPALVVDKDAFEHNLEVLSNALPGPRLRPHVKAHKSTALAAMQAAAGHHGFTCATAREVEGMAAAGLGADLLLANEVLDVARLARLARLDARVTVAVDSEETVTAAARVGIREVLVDVNVGLPRCGCRPEEAGVLAAAARDAGLEVRGVMGYEGHCVGLPDRALRAELTASAMELLSAAHAEVGGEVVSAGGTGTYDLNHAATEIQAGSYALMDAAYGRLGLPFRQALFLMATVISVSPSGYAVADCGLKALGMDHGAPEVEGRHDVLLVSDEHLTIGTAAHLRVGDRVRVIPAHVDPTVAYHERMHLVQDGDVLETWPVDLRGW
jgi:D-serine deaminase-like pyridoxal phosphate-dependent protein